mmetsp:Transcript_32344/g.62175  ORF Transcript_32344/g.62175 Transcript_32344/m.62175 type:complete len:288 (+) Transcript_32344:1055-1918(+)
MHQQRPGLRLDVVPLLVDSSSWVHGVLELLGPRASTNLEDVHSILHLLHDLFSHLIHLVVRYKGDHAFVALGHLHASRRIVELDGKALLHLQLVPGREAHGDDLHGVVALKHQRAARLQVVLPLHRRHVQRAVVHRDAPVAPLLPLDAHARLGRRLQRLHHQRVKHQDARLVVVDDRDLHRRSQYLSVVRRVGELEVELLVRLVKVVVHDGNLHRRLLLHGLKHQRALARRVVVVRRGRCAVLRLVKHRNLRCHGPAAHHRNCDLLVLLQHRVRRSRECKYGHGGGG